MSYSDERALERLNEDRKRLEDCILKLEGVEKLAQTSSFDDLAWSAAIIDAYSHIRAAMRDAFEEGSSERKLYAKAADFGDVGVKVRHGKERYKRAIEDSTAASKDLISEALGVIHKCIGDLKQKMYLANEKVGYPASGPIPPAEPVRIRDDPPALPTVARKGDSIFIWKLTWFGMGLDLKEIAKRIPEWMQKTRRFFGRKGSV